MYFGSPPGEHHIRPSLITGGKGNGVEETDKRERLPGQESGTSPQRYHESVHTMGATLDAADIMSTFNPEATRPTDYQERNRSLEKERRTREGKTTPRASAGLVPPEGKKQEPVPPPVSAHPGVGYCSRRVEIVRDIEACAEGGRDGWRLLSSLSRHMCGALPENSSLISDLYSLISDLYL